MEDNIEMNNEIVDNFDSENSAIEENHNNPGNNNNNFQYNIHDYVNEVIYNKLVSMHLLIRLYMSNMWEKYENCKRQSFNWQ